MLEILSAAALSGARQWLRVVASALAAPLALWQLQQLALAALVGIAGPRTGGEFALLEGAISVRAALLAKHRRVHDIYIRRDKQGPEVARLTALAAAAGVRVHRVGDDFIAHHARGQSHGGIIASAGPRAYLDLDQLVAGKRCPFVVLLDGLEDPFNFGHAVRALYAAGVDGLVVRPRDWLAVDGIIARASAGASELLPTAVAQTPVAAAAALREHGLTVACAARGEDATPLYGVNLAVPLLLIIGGEKRGISRSALDQADIVVRIPYYRRFAQSLGLAAAATVLVFEVMRQRTGRAAG